MDTQTIDGGLWVAPGVYLTSEDLDEMERDAQRRIDEEIDAELEWQAEQARLGSYCYLD